MTADATLSGPRLDHTTCTVYQTEANRQRTLLRTGLPNPGPARSQFCSPPPSSPRSRPNHAGDGRRERIQWPAQGGPEGRGQPAALGRRGAGATRREARAGTGAGRRRAASRGLSGEEDGREKQGKAPLSPGVTRGQGRVKRWPLTSLPDSHGNGCGRW